MTDRACAYCTKRLSTPSGDLECHARPPVVDVGKYARFPVVRPTDYCYEGFGLDTEAREALKADAAEQARLDGLVSQTQARAEADAAAPLLAPEAAAPEADPPKPKRSRRGSTAGEPGSLL